MASSYGRLTGKAGVCLSTLGPGAINFVTVAAYAQLGGMAHADVHLTKTDQNEQTGTITDR